MRIALVYSLPVTSTDSGEVVTADEDTGHSAELIAHALRRSDVEIRSIPLSIDAIDTIDTIEADCIFNVVEWTGNLLEYGVRATRRIEETGIPFTGATSENYFITSDKKLLKSALRAIGAPTPDWIVFHTGSEPIVDQVRYPVIVKLSAEHCSIGLSEKSIVSNRKDLQIQVQSLLQKFRQDVIAESYLPGTEYQVTIIEQDRQPVVLPIAEIVYAASDPRNFLTFNARWKERTAEYKRSSIGPSRLSPEKTERIRNMCVQVFTTLGFRGYARFDMRDDADGNPYILEANSNPGLSDDPDYGLSYAFRAAGFTFSEFLWNIVIAAMR